MKTMASVWFLVSVLVAVQEVFGNICNDQKNWKTCDECVRCAGNWCSEPGKAACSLQPEDSWCPYHKEKLDMDSSWSGKSTPGKIISTIYDEKLALVGQSTSLRLSYPGSTIREVTVAIVNTTQSANSIDIRTDDSHDCSSSNCHTKIKFQARTSFCSSNATLDESVYLKVTFGGIDESAVIKYHIPCACGCSSDIDVNSASCSGRGNYSCGVCSCNEGWTGNKCEQIVCPANRGDMTCKPLSDELPTCSGNGKCGDCDTCICDTKKPGHQYLNEKDQCMDLCQIITYSSDVPEQIYNSTLGFNETKSFISIEKKNVSLLDERDYANRTKWMECTEIYNECTLRYAAKKEDVSVIYVMVLESCNDREGGAVVAAPTVSILLAVLGILAVVATVGGILYWRHLNALPPVPLNNPGYVNIDAENCTCENPLYKSPTSNFKNPTYGKW